MSLSLTCIDGIEPALALGAEWDALMAASGADIGFHRGWIGPWGQHFAAGRHARVLILRDDSGLVALLPFASGPIWAGPIWAGPVRLRLARLMGPLPYFAVMRLPILPGREAEVFAALLAEGPGLLHHLGADLLCLSQLSAAGDHLAPLHAALTDLPATLAVRQDETAPHAVIALPDSFDAYLAGLSRKRRVKYRKSKEDLEARGVSSQCLTGSQARARLGDFIQRHNAQWQRIGRQGHFVDWPENAGFFATVLQKLTGDEGRLYVQTGPVTEAGTGTQFGADGQFLAAQFCFVSGRGCLALLTARDPGARVAAMGIGAYGQFERIEALIAQGVRWIDSGVGDYDHKTSLGAEMAPLHRIIIRRAGRVSDLRLRALLGWSALINLLYYRIWFLKIAPQLRPRLGLAPRPLWGLWRRTRL